MPRFCWFLVFLLSVAPLSRAQIKINAHPPAIVTRAFDPAHPPREMPPLKSDEAAVCSSKFSCGVQIEVEVSQVEGEKPKMQITGVTADLILDVIMWLPVEASEKIRLHEEGHRQISQIYYQRGEETARTLASQYIGRELNVSSTQPTATQPIIQRIASEFCHEYLGRIETPSEKAQQRYDALTDHGRNRLNEQEAIRQALKSAK